MPPSFATPRSLSSGAQSRDPLAAPQDEERDYVPAFNAFSIWTFSTLSRLAGVTGPTIL
jgi:hypothetical protein